MSLRERQNERLRSVRRQVQGALNTLGKKIAAAELDERTTEEEIDRAQLQALLSRLDRRIRATGEQIVEERVEAWEAKDHSAPPATEPVESAGDTSVPASTATTGSCAA